MQITFDEDKKIFHLSAGGTSYVVKAAFGELLHLYWGKALSDPDCSYLLRPAMRAFSPDTHPDELGISLDILPLEYPSSGTGDFRQPAFIIETADGARLAELKYSGHKILTGKPALDGLPSTYIELLYEADTLIVEMRDDVIGLCVELIYTAFRNFDAIARSARFINNSGSNIKILNAMSASVDFMDANYDMLQLSGAWARERHVETKPLIPGTQSIESRRGASSHQQNPFMALISRGCTEFSGEAYGFSLVYSGNFLASCEVDQFSTARSAIGINPYSFSWLLGPGETFQTPEAVLVYSGSGLSGMSDTFHRLYRNNLARGVHRDEPRPVLINNWEATYFAFDEEKLVEIAKSASLIGVELFVLDDGWFGVRNEDNCSLGDWVVNTGKLPGGIKGIAEKVNALGMKFGLWFEPEMISKDSDLYRAHPDWCMHVEGRRRTDSRNQLVLDLSRPEVCDFIIESVTAVLKSAPIAYVKWDMNRSLLEVASTSLSPERKQETFHRYMLGLYHVLETITSAFPEILFESCSGGGGRFDPGMLHYMPQTWTSDDTDAVERLKIQHGTSMVYPAISIGSHVSAVPNHQVHRSTPLIARIHTAMAGNLGLELDLSMLTQQETEMLKTHIDLYKNEVRDIVQFGRMYRLISPFEGNSTAWLFINEDKSKVVLFFFRVLAEAQEPFRTIRLVGLDPEKTYKEAIFGARYKGDTLMRAGLPSPIFFGDYGSALIRLEAVS
jgi:alpha-galactosidase